MIVVVGYNEVRAGDTNTDGVVELRGVAALGTDRAHMRTIFEAEHLHSVVAAVGHEEERVVG